ncbi:MAG: hypothetical protein DRR00_12930 [Candidatus Parabeggiatoa sp. nov. 3]|nr:MAG: hypothetical protein DRR00_12930 [Gammaproteobacteria bacterium]RKZ66588.1 MAG: hypothetical protein DRQ99_09295 [Gammaproteobacteria bacterium]
MLFKKEFPVYNDNIFGYRFIEENNNARDARDAKISNVSFYRASLASLASLAFISIINRESETSCKSGIADKFLKD